MLPETAAPSVGAFEETFRRLHDDGADGIVCVNLSAHLSATMQSAQVAAKALDGLCPIEIIDSAIASMGIGILALHAARRASEGADVATIAREVNERRDRQKLFAALDTLEYLRKGGRIGGAQAMLGSMLSIKPIITVDRRRGRAGRQGAHPLEGAALHPRPDPRGKRRVDLRAALRRRPTSTSSSSWCARRCPAPRSSSATSAPSSACTSGPRAVGLTWIERAG